MRRSLWCKTGGGGQPPSAAASTPVTSSATAADGGVLGTWADRGDPTAALTGCMQSEGDRADYRMEKTKGQRGAHIP